MNVMQTKEEADYKLKACYLLYTKNSAAVNTVIPVSNESLNQNKCNVTITGD